jgi:preprotein translocase subunit SecY
MVEALRTALRLPDLRNKILVTGLILVIYQFAAHVPVVGSDASALRALFEGNSAGLLGVLNLLSGGALQHFSVIGNGVYPYITASIILQVLMPVIPRLDQLSKEPGGKQKIEQYTYYLALPMSVLQTISQVQIFNTIGGQPIVPGFGVSDPLLTLTVIITQMAGTMFAVWLGQLITEQGIGNGLSIIIFSGIVAAAPQNLVRLVTNSTQPVYQIILFIALTLVSIVAIILVQEGVRRIPVQYGKRVRGNKQYGGTASHIPIKVNPVGMIPLIFAQSIITFPALMVNLFPDGPVRQSITATFGQQEGLVYWLTFFLLVFGFTFIYSDIMVGNQNLSENLQRNGGYIPGIRPGKKTQDYIAMVTRRVVFVGALFLGIIAILPGVVGFINRVLFPNEVVSGVAGNAAYVLSGSGLIIVVGVVIDTMRQLEAQLVMRNYDRFI